MEMDKLNFCLDTYDFLGAEKIMDNALNEATVPSADLLFTKAIAVFGQYTFGSIRIKEVGAYLNKIDTEIQATSQQETLLIYCAENALSELTTFHTEMGNEVRKASVGTITDPTYKMVTDTAVIASKMDGKAGHIVEVLKVLQSFETMLQKRNILVLPYAKFAATQGTDLGKEINDNLVTKGYTQQSTSSCYVATAVYGSSDHPSVMVLRDFRDLQLLKAWWGRALVHAYYLVGPIIASVVITHFWSYRISRIVIDKIVQRVR